jgi:hypothetical protein
MAQHLLRSSEVEFRCDQEVRGRLREKCELERYYCGLLTERSRKCAKRG